MKPGNRKGRPNYRSSSSGALPLRRAKAGVSVSKLSLANGVNANMISVGAASIAQVSLTICRTQAALLPVVLAGYAVDGSAGGNLEAASPAAKLSTVEIIFADAVVRVHEGVDAALLRTIFQSLRP